MPKTWLSQLPDSSLFNLPPANIINATAELIRPNSPRLSHMFPSTSTSSASPALNASSSTRYATRRDRAGGRRSRIVLARGVDLIIAVGRELRLASLAEYKARYDDDTEMMDQYKVLNTPAITFEIRQLILNPTNKLLAVVGYSEVAIVVLPRKGWNNMIGSQLECRCLLVGKFYHALPASPAIAQVSFHDLGENGSSLLVLTEDGILREYSVSDDAEEPAQVVDLCDQGKTENRRTDFGSSSMRGYGSVSRNSSGQNGFSADDVNASKAVAFCFGAGKGDWGALTLYGLMKNGDIVSVCPFLPSKASLSISYIRSLANFVSTKVDYLAESSPSSDLTTLYAQQLKYVNALVRQISSSSSASSPQKLAPTLYDDEVEDTDRLIPITPPLGFDGRSSRPKRQGPFLLQPEPIELDTTAESFACDLVYISYSARGDNRNNNSGGDDASTLGVFVISYSDGKVDLCIEVEKIEARWSSSSVITADEDGLPVLAVYESIDLGLVALLKEDRVEEVLMTNWTTIVKDPLYADTLYLHHAMGSHCLLLSKWLESVALSIEEDEDEDEETMQKEVERSLRSQQGTEVLWILKTVSIEENEPSTRVEGIAIINDVYLGYSILLMTASLQLVAIELALRVDTSLVLDLPSTSSLSLSSKPKTRGIDSDPPAYLSLLDSPFDTPPLLDPRRSGVSSVPRVAIQSSSASAAASLPITPSTLRFLGKTVESFRHEIRDLVAAADAVQCRLELQMREMSRQLHKLKELEGLSESLRSSIAAAPSSSSSPFAAPAWSSTAGVESLSERLQRVTEAQTRLLQRTDRLLQRLINQHQPILSSYEIKWFDELDRLDRDVVQSERGLSRRVESAEAKVESLRPALEAMKKEEKEGGADGRKTKDVLGASQMKRLEAMLSDEAKLIIDARRKIDRLTNLLAKTSL